MKVKEIMSSKLAWCTSGTKLEDVAKMMAAHDCGAIPVLESETNPKPAGVITDRDIVTRILAEGRNPLQSAAKDAMTPAAVVVRQGIDVEEAARTMKKSKLRRVVVISDDGACVGMLALADLANALAPTQSASVLKQVSMKKQRSAQDPKREPQEADLDEALSETFPASDPVAVRRMHKSSGRG